MTNDNDEPDPTWQLDADTEEWLRVRRVAGQTIDPETAEVDWSYGVISDPYGVHPEPPDEEYCVGRVYWARAPGSDVWVEFGDLPEATRERLWKKYCNVLAFPAGLEGLARLSR